MKYKVIYFTFKKALNSEQEEMLIAFFQAIVKKIKQKVLKSLKLLKNPLYQKIAGAPAKTSGEILQTIYDNLATEGDMSLLKLDKPNETQYSFLMAFESLAGLNVNIPYASSSFWENTRDRVIGMFSNDLIKRLGLTDSDYFITYGEMEQ